MTPGMRAILARLAAHKPFFVVRGGIALAHFVAPAARPIDDLDLLAPIERFDADRLRREFEALIQTDATSADGGSVAILSSEVIWAETPWPGLRYQLDVSGESLQVDIGFGDPLVEGPIELDLVQGVSIQTCRPETLFAWKVHGLFERGPGKWRAKDVYDLVLLRRHAAMQDALLAKTIPLAFESRGDDLQIAERFLSGAFGQSRGSRRKWKKFTSERGIPETELRWVLDDLAHAIRPWL